MYFDSAAVILLASLALIVQVLLPYNNTGSVFLCCVIMVVKDMRSEHESVLQSEKEKWV
jgi:hypothetical protein